MGIAFTPPSPFNGANNTRSTLISSRITQTLRIHNTITPSAAQEPPPRERCSYSYILIVLSAAPHARDGSRSVPNGYNATAAEPLPAEVDLAGPTASSLTRHQTFLSAVMPSALSNRGLFGGKCASSASFLVGIFYFFSFLVVFLSLSRWAEVSTVRVDLLHGHEYQGRRTERYLDVRNDAGRGGFRVAQRGYIGYIGARRKRMIALLLKNTAIIPRTSTCANQILKKNKLRISYSDLSNRLKSGCLLRCPKQFVMGKVKSSFVARPTSWVRRWCIAHLTLQSISSLPCVAANYYE